MKQSKIISAIEVTLNIGSGFLISMLLWQFIAPVLGYEITIGENVQLTSVFTVVSLIRSYAWRRIFTRLDRRLHETFNKLSSTT